MTLATPAHLSRLARTFLVEEVRAEVRHATRNRLGAIRNAVFYLRRQVDTKTNLMSEVPRVPRFFELIETEVQGASAFLSGDLPSQDGLDPVASLDSVCDRLLGALEFPQGFEVVREGPAGLVAKLPAEELELVLFLLLENAVESPGVTRATIRVSSDDAGVRLAVVDDGSGFQREALERGCENFFSTRAEHQGLGLAVARRIVERRWEGEIELGNAQGDEHGRVSLTLPHAKWEASGAGRVLFVDDNETNRFTLGALLEDEGYEVVEAESLAAARARLPGEFALAILDLNLGDGHGTELIPELHQQASPPVVAVLSGSSARKEIPGADLVLTKADNPGLLLEALRGALSARTES